MKKIAFTLAEVLLTLTIVGVVSALTVPNIMSAVDEKEISFLLKKADENFYTAPTAMYGRFFTRGLTVNRSIFILPHSAHLGTPFCKKT